MTAEQEPSEPPVKQDGKTIYDELAQMVESSRKAQEMKNETDKLSEIVTKPESRRFGSEEEFRFLVHVPLDIQSRLEELGLDKFVQAEKPLNTSLIDQDHTWTFEGMSGLIIEPSESGDDVLGAWAYDSGLNDMVRQEDQPSALSILQDTRSDNYNQINIQAGKIAGVYIRIREDGSVLGDPSRAEELRQYATEHQLPVAEIVVQSQTFTDESPSIHQPTKDLTTIEFAKGGRKYRIDALVADPVRPLSRGVPHNGYYLRARELDGYGQAGGDVSDPAVMALIVTQLEGIIEGGEADELTRQALLAAVDSFNP